MNGQCSCGYRPGRISSIDCRCVTHRELNERLRKIDPNEGYYQKEIDELKANKQDKLIAGQNITIEGSLISADLDSTNFYNKTETDELLAEKQDTLTAGENITISENVISSSAHMLVTLTPTGAPVGGVTDYTWTSEHTYAELVADLDKVAFKTNEAGSETVIVPVELYEALEDSQNVIFGTIALNDAAVPKITNIELIVRPDGTAKATETTALISSVTYTAGDNITISPTNEISAIIPNVYGFDTVADMKASTELKDGDYAITAGFYAKDDGGEAYYKISATGTANEMDVIAVGLLYANLIRPEVMNPIMIGAKGDGATDDSLIIQQAILYSKNNSIDTIDGLNKTYLVSDVIDLPTSMSSVGEKGLYADYGVTIKNFHFILKDACAALTSVLNLQIPVGEQTIIDNVEIDGNSANQSTDVGAQNGGLHGIRVGKAFEDSGGIIIKNSYIHDCYSDCILIRSADYDFAYVDNCKIERAGRNGITDNSKNSLVENCVFIDNGYRVAPKSAYHIEADRDFGFGKKTLKNCVTTETSSTPDQDRGGVNVYFNDADYTFEEFNIIGCSVDKLNINTSNTGNMNYLKNVNLINSTFGPKYHWIGKTESAGKLEFSNIKIDGCTFGRYLVIQGGTSTNKPDVYINNTKFTGTDTAIELYFGMNNVEITNCQFVIDAPKSSDGATCNCINVNFTDNSTVYTINNILVEDCVSHNYWRIVDNHTYSSNRTGKTIGSLVIKNNVYETTGSGKILYNWNGGNITKCIIDGNMATATVSTSKKFEPGTCAYVIGVNNICEFPTSQGFDVTGATKQALANNLFSDT